LRSSVNMPFGFLDALMSGQPEWFLDDPWPIGPQWSGGGPSENFTLLSDAPIDARGLRVARARKHSATQIYALEVEFLRGRRPRQNRREILHSRRGDPQGRDLTAVHIWRSDCF